tara:strand:- start:1597 stop:2079 length:483 start_codon:yes stop_codon:yes gene_type:complete
MSVSFGSALTSANVNGAFVSKSADSTVTSVLDLNDSGSGTRITNVQQEINNLTNNVNAATTIASGGTISISTTQKQQLHRVSGNGGAQTLSTTPFGTSAPVDGTIIRVLGTSDTNTISLTNNDASNGAIINGNCTLKKYNIITFLYDASLSRYIELARNF